MPHYRGLQGRPEDYVNPTGMMHASGGAKTDLGATATPAIMPPSRFTAEQDAKWVEKIRSHASSHHTAGTVTLDT